MLSRPRAANPPQYTSPWEEPKYGLGLLRVSRAVSVEAVPVLYGRNILDFTLTYCHEVNRFFEWIGRRNACHIRHIVIDFPVRESSVQGLRLDQVVVDELYVEYLRAFQRHCLRLPALITIRLHLVSLLRMPLIYDDDDRLRDVLGMEEALIEAMDLVDIHFQAIPSLSEVTCELDYLYRGFPPLAILRNDFEVREEDRLSYKIRKQVERHGLTFKLVDKPMEQV